MLERLEFIKDVLIVALNKLENVDEIRLMQILSPLENCTRILYGENYTTISVIKSAINLCIKNLTSLTLSVKKIFALRAYFVVNLKDCYANIELDNIFNILTLLDHRFKKHDLHQLINLMTLYYI